MPHPCLFCMVLGLEPQATVVSIETVASCQHCKNASESSENTKKWMLERVEVWTKNNWQNTIVEYIP